VAVTIDWYLTLGVPLCLFDFYPTLRLCNFFGRNEAPVENTVRWAGIYLNKEEQHGL
jgi:hypothetical protein